MFDRFTDCARKVLQLADNEARRFRHEYVGTEHLLLGLIKEGSGVAPIVLKNLDIDLRKIRLEVEKIVQSGSDDVPLVGQLPQTPRAKKALEYAVEESRNLNHHYVGSEHLLLGRLREEEGVAAVILQNMKLDFDRVREEIHRLLGDNRSTVRPSPLLMPQEETSDLPAKVLQELAEVNERLQQFNGQKESAVAAQDFEKAAYLRDHADRLKKHKRILLRLWYFDYVVDPSWLRWHDASVLQLAEAIALKKRWDDLPSLADALEKAGCTNHEMLDHCREGRPHESACWVVNLLRGAATDSPPAP